MPLTVLNRQRAALKAKITKLDKFLETVNEDSDNYLADSPAAVELNQKMAGLKKIQHDIEAIRKSYYELAQEEDLEAIDASLEDMDARLDKDEVMLLSFISKLTWVNAEADKGKSQESPTVRVKYSESSTIAHVPLPQIPLPQFSGLYDEWSNFKSAFINLITNNSHLTDAQRCYYLHASLRGEARHIQTSDDTYESLFKALEDRYDNRKIIVDTHVQKILNYPKLTQESAKDLRDMLDSFKGNLRALKILGLDRDKLSDILLISIITQKLDRETRRQYEMASSSREVPDFHEFFSFLEKRCQMLESLARNVPIKAAERHAPPSMKSLRTKALVIHANNSEQLCVVCKGTHPLHKCIDFKNMTQADRYNVVKGNKLCLNCLHSSHKASDCKSKITCSVCKAKHHSMLHRYQGNTSVSTITVPKADDSVTKVELEETAREKGGGVACSKSSLVASVDKRTVLLSTAVVYIRDAWNHKRPVVCILDSASQASFITRECATTLGLKVERILVPVSGINGSTLNVKKKTVAVISDSKDKFQYSHEFLIIPKIAEITPARKIDVSRVHIPRNVPLADPKFSEPKKIDLLLGSELFYEFLRSGQIRTEDNNRLLLQETIFGYIVTGAIEDSRESKSAIHCCLSTTVHPSDDILRAFWELEGVNETKLPSSDELRFCEEHYSKHHYRNPEGHYVVQMPLKPDASLLMLGNSKEVATKRLDQVWRRLEHNPTLRDLYLNFMDTYESLGHMKEVEEENSSERAYYLPHHGVYRPDKSTTKLRVVFDASARTTNGISLNDILLKGGIVQDDLFSIILRFRKHMYAITADVEMMFRKIKLDPSQFNLQRIVWKRSIDGPLKSYNLQTVTYGTACAPYLATRTLQQLAYDEKTNFPLASLVVMTDMYMDDVLSGASDLSSARELQSQLNQLFNSGGMKLRKWCANDPELLMDIPSEDREYQFYQPDSHETKTVKTLGMIWDPSLDLFSFKVTIPPEKPPTKRLVLSIIARIFDPLGLVGPVISKAKIFMQKLWLLKIDWNTELPEDIAKEWNNFVAKLKLIEDIQVPRFCLSKDSDRIIIHGFADASKSAYGAVIYLQSIAADGVSCHVLCSKSRVAPLQSVTIPRLELCACVLLSQLVTRVLSALKLKINDVLLWSDSTIALAWIRASPHQLKTFISNRVATIQELTKDFKWQHVSSEHNPGDIISRGIYPIELAQSSLWWHGPDFLQEDNAECIPQTVLNSDEEDFLQELKPAGVLTLSTTMIGDVVTTVTNLSNSFVKIIRIFAYILRFCNNLKPGIQKREGFLSAEEFKVASNYLLRLIQSTEFREDISNLKGSNQVRPKSKLKCLNPFLDSSGLLRVGGRLGNSNLSYDERHPIILPKNHKVNELIFDYLHKKFLHVGPQSLLYCVRQKYWPINGRSTARKIVHKCIVCFKNKPIVAEQLMGSLPSERTTPSAPFNHTGADFCGPFSIKYKGQRKGIFQKIYVAIFICFATRAIHLETVSDLTSESFIASLKRFFARRGKSATLFTDNATNFIGANAEIKRLHNLLRNPDDALSSYLSSEGVDWKFLPPRAPNFGGLWEAGVKSFKHHLKRVMGTYNFTHEEFVTVTTQIEGILNSRPITPLSSHVEDYEALTPGHFLIGRPLNALVEPELLDINKDRLSRWQQTTRVTQYLWKNGKWTI